MTFKEYLDYFQKIISETHKAAPYNNPEFLHYTNLNWSRMNRWTKKGILTEEVKSAVNKISIPQKWIIITEPWCGDAAHIVPFLHKIAQENSLIHVSYELRDSPPHRIENYLTNGGKSIPKLIIRDENDRDLATWGSRPAECQQTYEKLKAENTGLASLVAGLQNWYNKDAGEAIQAEISDLLKDISS